MADNVAITAGSGTTIAADDIGGGVLAQRVKPVFGADGTGTDVSSANPLPVDTELTTADLDTGAGTDTRAVVGVAGAASGGAVLVGATSGGALKGDLTSIGGTAVDSNSGNKSAGTQRVVIATDQPTLPVNGKVAYGTGAAITITLTSLGATSGRESLLVDNTTNLYTDALVWVKLKSSAVSAGDTVAYVYAAGSVNDGSSDQWADTVTGADAAITLDSPTQLKLLGVINFGAAGAGAATKKGGPWSVAAAFGGTLPKKWSIVVVNSNAALTSTASDHAAAYQGVYGA